MKIYLFPGQGADCRLFHNMKFDESRFDLECIRYNIPERNMSMKQFALQLVNQIDTSKKFVLLGVSIGGMLCTELADLLNPEKVIIISSAKCRRELPPTYRFMKCIPLYKFLPKNLIKAGALIAQPLVEPDRKKGKEVFVSMLKDKDPVFLKRTIHMIVTWPRKTYSDDIVHIHGSGDNTLPIRRINEDYVVPNGSHMMVYTRSEEVSRLVDLILDDCCEGK